MSKCKCPHCGGDQAKCKDSRPSPVKTIVRRRVYECEACGYRFSTEEKVAALEGGGVIMNDSHLAFIFIRDVEALARKYFGSPDGKLNGASPSRYKPGANRGVLSVAAKVARQKKVGP